MMGMYTQVRGWLNVDSIGDYEGNRYKEILSRLEKAKQDFQSDELIKVDRKWVCENTIAYKGGNGSVFLFFGTELKNYDNPAYRWVEYLIKYFPNAEGRIDFCYEEEYIGESQSRYLLIRDGQIIKDDYTETWTNGYGNTFK
jgi:hypothetical protein